MEKNIYITPAAKEVNLLTMEMLATSNEVRVSNETTTEDARMSNERRDGWGDLWY